MTTITLQDCIDAVMYDNHSRYNESLRLSQNCGDYGPQKMKTYSLPTLFVVVNSGKIRSRFDTYCKATNEKIYQGDAIRHYTFLFIDGSSWSGWTSDRIFSMINYWDTIEGNYGDRRLSTKHEMEMWERWGKIKRSNCNVGIFRRKKNQTAKRGWTHAPAPELPKNSRQDQNSMPTRMYGRDNMVCEAWK